MSNEIFIDEKSMKYNVIEKDVDLSEAVIHAIVEIEDCETGEKAKFCCKNIFDMGYYVSPAYEISEGIEGGYAEYDYWKHHNEDGKLLSVRELTYFEKKAVRYLYKYSPIDTEIRMCLK